MCLLIARGATAFLWYNCKQCQADRMLFYFHVNKYESAWSRFTLLRVIYLFAHTWQFHQFLSIQHHGQTFDTKSARNSAIAWNANSMQSFTRIWSSTTSTISTILQKFCNCYKEITLTRNRRATSVLRAAVYAPNINKPAAVTLTTLVAHWRSYFHGAKIHVNAAS